MSSRQTANLLAMADVFIYGSCTTRDSVEYWDSSKMELSGYVARQSLISALSPGNEEGFDLSRIASSFQRRMVQKDLAGTAVTEVRAHLNTGGVAVWDLTDERNGVLELANGRQISGTANSTAGLVQQVEVVRRLFFVEDAFLEKWCAAADEFARLAGVNTPRTVVNYTPWAKTFRDGSPVPYSYPGAGAFNERLEHMVNYLEGLGFTISRLGEDEVFGEENHKWGPAPFHYNADTYRLMVNRLEQAISGALRG